MGSSVNIQKRWKAHIRDLRANRHHSPYLQRAWNKYGEACFQFTVLEECKEEELLSKEQIYIDCGISEYNLCKIAGNTRGRQHTDEAKKKMSEHRRGRTHNVGYKHTPEARKNMSEARKLQYLLAPVSEEFRKRMSEINKGKPKSEETRRKLAQAHIGMRASPETKKKMSESRKRYLERMASEKDS